jgi:hypothetical protein
LQTNNLKVLPRHALQPPAKTFAKIRRLRAAPQQQHQEKKPSKGQ